MDDDHLSRVLEDLLDPDGPEVINVGSMDSAYLGAWPSRATNEIVITMTQRNHYLANHPEMIGFEYHVIQALREPDLVNELVDAEFTMLCLLRQDNWHDVVAVVSISSLPELSNSLITARRQRRRRLGQPASRHRLIWERKEK